MHKYKLVSLMTVFFLCLNCYGNDLQLVVHQSIEFIENKEVFKNEKFWKKSIRPSFWNKLFLIKTEDKSFCLMYRSLPTRKQQKEELILVEKIDAKDCFENSDNPIWRERDIDQVSIELDEREFFLKFLRENGPVQYRFNRLSSVYRTSGISIKFNGGSRFKKRQINYNAPCLQLDKACNEIVPNRCSECPNGVVGVYEKEKCQGQSLYCRRDSNCGFSEQEACQLSRETSLNCEERKKSYYCQSNLNMVCEKGRMVCY